MDVMIHALKAVLFMLISSSARGQRYAEHAYIAWRSFDVIARLLHGRRITRDQTLMLPTLISVGGQYHNIWIIHFHRKCTMQIC